MKISLRFFTRFQLNDVAQTSSSLSDAEPVLNGQQFQSSEATLIALITPRGNLELNLHNGGLAEN